jgi:nicotinate-nucleotide adenylyltransferase
VKVTLRRVGLFGGTFDPPHLGHVAALSEAWASGCFDEIVVTVAGDPYLKSNEGVITPAIRRLGMAQAAFAALPGVRVSAMEIERSGPTYTIDTVRELLTPDVALTLILGADVVPQLVRWREAETLASMVTLYVLPRGEEVVSIPAGWRGIIASMEPVDLSSTLTRERLENGENPSGLVPEAVIPLL